MLYFIYSKGRLPSMNRLNKKGFTLVELLAVTIILILIYIDRICNINKCKLSYYNIHKLILGSMIVAIKYNEDEHYSSKFYAKIGGVSLAEIINLEYSFLSLINFNLYVNEDLFNKYNDYLLSSDSDDDDSDNYNYEGSNDEENNCNKF